MTLGVFLCSVRCCGKTYSTGEVFGPIGAPSKRWLDKQLNDGRFPGRKVGRSWRMTERDVADAIEICKNDFDGVVSDAPSGLTPAGAIPAYGAR